MKRVVKSIHKLVIGKKVKNSIKQLKKVGILTFSGGNYQLISSIKDILWINQPSIILENDTLEKLLTFTYDIGDKQYRSYSWNDSKVQCLLTVNAALIAGILFLAQFLTTNTQIDIVGLPIIFFIFAFFLLSTSLIYCLKHSIPRLNSKIGNEDNLRTIIGINRFMTIEEILGKENSFSARDKYSDIIRNMQPIAILRMNAMQIVGMAKNNNTSHKMIKKAVLATIFSIYLLMIGIMFLILQTIYDVDIVGCLKYIILGG